MKKAVELDLVDLSDIFEGFVKKFDKMTLTERIDLAARIKPVAKVCKDLDDRVKEEIKSIRNGVEGEVLGGMFKAKLTIVPVDRLQQKKLQEEKPKIYAQYLRHDEDERVTYHLR